MKILLLKGVSQYGAMRNYIDHWNYSCQKMGHDTYLFDALSGYTTEQLILLCEKLQPDLILCCNAIYAEIADKLLVAHDSRYCTVIYDNPVVHRGRLESLDGRSCVFSCDRYYEEFIRKHYPKIGKVGFLPLSGDGSPKMLPYEERSIDILFTGSYFDKEKKYEPIKNLPKGIRCVADRMIELMIENPFILLWQAVDLVFRELNHSLSETQRWEVIHTCSCVDYYMRAYVRDQVMKEIVDAGIKVHVFGNGWEDFVCHQPENLIHMEGYGEVALEALGNAKISLNIMPWFRAGIQERNVAAMLSGAISLTDTSTYIEENFENGKDIVTYSLTQMDRIPFIIQSILSNEKRSKEIAENGYQKAVMGHTWDHRMKELFLWINE